MNEKLMRHLGRFKDKYPHQLDAKFPRITEKMAQLWNTPQMAAYFTDLMIDTRGGRVGFPPEIAREIFRLSLAYDEILARGVEASDIWHSEVEVAKPAVEQTDVKFIPAHMLKAAEYSDPAKVVLFLNAGVAVDARDERDWTPLMVAAFNGNEKVAKVLIDHGADPEAHDRDGYTPLHWAALNGYAEVVRVLIDKGVNTNVRSNANWTPLLQAANKGHAAIVALLLEANADPEIASNDGWTPLLKAVANGHAQCVRILMLAGASVTAKHQDGSTPISLAERGRSPEIRSILRQKI